MTRRERRRTALRAVVMTLHIPHHHRPACFHRRGQIERGELEPEAFCGGVCGRCLFCDEPLRWTDDRWKVVDVQFAGEP